MSSKDSSSKIKAQQPGVPSSGKKAGSTKYKMQAAQLAQEAARIAAEQEAQAKAQKEAVARGESQSEDTVRGLWKSRVLASYKSKGSKDSNTLLAKISDGKAALEVGDRHRSANVQEVMINTVDKMFDIFQNCAYEFNKIAAGSELEINWIRPFLSKEVTANWHQQENANLIFSGRVSTRRWTMVVKGTTEDIVAFILPADKLIGFALSNNNFKPYFQMIPVDDNLDVHWQIEEHIMPPELFPTIYKELFDGLIRFAREEAHADEVFTLRQIGINLVNESEETVADEEQARKKLYQDQFFQDMRSREDFQPVRQVPEFAKPEFSRPEPPTPSAPPAAAPPPAPAAASAPAPSTNTGGWKQVTDVNIHNPENARSIAERAIQRPAPPQMHPQPAQAHPNAQQHLQQPQPNLQQQQQQPHMPTMNPQWPSLQQPAPQAPPQQAQQQQAPQQQPAPPQPQYQQQQYAQAPQQPQYPPQQQQAPSQQQTPPQPQYPQQRPPQPPAPARPASFPEALSALLSCLDQELEVVAKAGSDAFAQRDLARADAALKFSGRLNEFRTLARELYEYYGGGKASG